MRIISLKLRKELAEIFATLDPGFYLDQCHSEKPISWWVDKFRPPPVLPVKEKSSARFTIRKYSPNM